MFSNAEKPLQDSPPSDTIMVSCHGGAKGVVLLYI